jgi:hypothetical protein
VLLGSFSEELAPTPVGEIIEHSTEYSQLSRSTQARLIPQQSGLGIDAVMIRVLLE